jgi:hypothetical protein
MVERYVFLKLNDEHATAEGRAAVAAHAREVLPKIPGVDAVTVGVPADDRSAASWDISIVVRFASAGDVEPYRVHPDHRSFVDDYLAPKMVIVKAWNFDVG